MKKKIITFYSDLRGTFLDDSVNRQNRYEHVELLFQYLEELRIVLDCDEVKFSFITSDEFNDEVIDSIIEAEKHINNYDNINFGRIFSINEYMDNKIRTLRDQDLKIGDIKKDTERLQNVYDVKQVFYADDATINIELADSYCRRFGFPGNLELILADNGINTINATIQSFINKEKYKDFEERPIRKI